MDRFVYQRRTARRRFVGRRFEANETGISFRPRSTSSARFARNALGLESAAEHSPVAVSPHRVSADEIHSRFARWPGHGAFRESSPVAETRRCDSELARPRVSFNGRAFDIALEPRKCARRRIRRIEAPRELLPCSL